MSEATVTLILTTITAVAVAVTGIATVVLQFMARLQAIRDAARMQQGVEKVQRTAAVAVVKVAEVKAINVDQTAKIDEVVANVNGIAALNAEIAALKAELVALKKSQGGSSS